MIDVFRDDKFHLCFAFVAKAGGDDILAAG